MGAKYAPNYAQDDSLLVRTQAGIARVLSLDFVYKIAKGQPQILRLTTPKLKVVWGPFRSG